MEKLYIYVLLPRAEQALITAVIDVCEMDGDVCNAWGVSGWSGCYRGRGITPTTLGVCY